MENSDTSAGEKVGHTAEFAGSNGGSQALLAYAVAGVALAAVIASGIMFISHYPSEASLQALDAPREGNPEDVRRAPLRLVSPRAITVEETRGVRPEQVSEAQSAPGTSGRSEDLHLAAEEALSTEPVPAEPELPERVTAEPDPISPLPREDRPLGPIAGENPAKSESGSRLESATLRSETLGTQLPAVEDVALARSDELLEIQENAPSQKGEDGPPEQPLPVADQRSSGEAEAQATQVDHELAPPAPLAQPPREGPVYSYPDLRRPYAPVMPPFPPPPYYMPRGPGHTSGYYRANTAKSDD